MENVFNWAKIEIYKLKLNVYIFCSILNQTENEDMRRKNANVLLILGVILSIVLLMVWLFLGTTLEEESNPETDPLTIEQNI
ncbi:hypothetical protein DW103_15340 [Parabacteroides sp. AM08-6]|nr:hypothetical protein DW103_15340 [Parabacteroides sp. AM08-6]